MRIKKTTNIPVLRPSNNTSKENFIFLSSNSMKAKYYLFTLTRNNRKQFHSITKCVILLSLYREDNVISETSEI